MAQNTFDVHVYEDIEGGWGTLRFRESPQLPRLHHGNATNQLQDIFGMVASAMAYEQVYGTANILIENGKHSGAKLSLTIGLSR